MNNYPLYRRMGWLVLLAAALLLLSSTPAVQAATFTVNSTTDAVDASPGNGVCATAGAVCTLRAAIQEANALAGDDTITLPAGTYGLTIAGTGEDAGATGDLDITGNLTINGNTTTPPTIDANSIDRVFETRPAAATTLTVSMSNLTIREGSLPAGITNPGAGIAVDVVSNDGRTNLTLTNVRITANSTGNNGGGVSLTRQAADTTDPSLSLENSTISGNTALNGGGIQCAGCDLTVNNSTISGNGASTTGGGINITTDQATVNLFNTTIASNTANGDGGGIGKILGAGTIALNFTTVSGNTADNDTNGAGDGGGIRSNSNTTLQNSIVQGNTDSTTPATNDCSGTVTSNNFNVVGAGTGCPSGGANDSTAAANLGALQDNGGDTFTRLPGGGSSALNRIPAGMSGCTNTGTSVDQRGAARAFGTNRGGTACDSGAAEGDSSQTPTAVSLQTAAAVIPSPLLLILLVTVAAGLALLTLYLRRRSA